MIRILLLIFFFFNFLFSNVVLKAPSSFVLGEPFIFTLEYSGSEEPSFPNINKIAGFSVQSAGRSNQISIINGQRSQVISQKFMLFANSEFTIPAIEVKTSSSTFKTKPKKITVKTPSKTKSKDFDLTLDIDKNSLFVGEQAILTLKFKYRLGLNILNMELNQPNFDGFWVEPLGKSTSSVQNGFEIHTLKYVIFPQRAGKNQIKPVSINIAMPDRGGSYSFFRAPQKVKRFYSNSIDLDVKALPQNLKLIGDFSIDSTIDKTSVKYGEAVSFKVKISGSGNLDDIDDIKLNIPNVTIYENKPDKEFTFKDGKYSGVYTKTFSIVADSSFKIDRIKLDYLDSKTKTKKTIQTKEYRVEVLGKQVQQKEVVLQKAEDKDIEQKEVVVIKTSYKERVLFFIFGVLCSLLLMFILYYFKREKSSSKQEDKPLIKVVKSSKEKSDLLKVLAPYIKKDEELDTLIYTLEEIEDKELKSIKKQIIAKLKNIDIKS